MALPCALDRGIVQTIISLFEDVTTYTALVTSTKKTKKDTEK